MSQQQPRPATVHLDPETVTDLTEQLTLLAHRRRTPEGYRDALIYWSVAVAPDMEPGDLQTVTDLLRDLARDTATNPVDRMPAGRWARELTDRLARYAIEEA